MTPFEKEVLAELRAIRKLLEPPKKLPYDTWSDADVRALDKGIKKLARQRGQT